MPIILPKRVFRIAAAVAFFTIAGTGYLLMGGRSHAQAETKVDALCGDKTAELEAKWKEQGQVNNLDVVLNCHIEASQKAQYATGLKAELSKMSEADQFEALKALPEREPVNVEMFFQATTLFSSVAPALVGSQESFNIFNDGNTIGVEHDDLKVVILNQPLVEASILGDHAVTGYSFFYKGHKAGEISLPSWVEGSISSVFTKEQANEFAKEIGIFKLEDGYLVRLPSQREEGNYTNTFVRHVLVNSAGFKEITIPPDQDFQDYASNSAAALQFDSIRTFYTYRGGFFDGIVRIVTNKNPNGDNCEAKIQTIQFRNSNFSEAGGRGLSLPCAEEFDYPDIYDSANPSINYAQQLLVSEKYTWLHPYVFSALGKQIDRVYPSILSDKLNGLKTFKDGEELEGKTQKLLALMNSAGANPANSIKPLVDGIATKAKALDLLPTLPESQGYKQEHFDIYQVVKDTPGTFMAVLRTTNPPKRVVVAAQEVDQISHAGSWRLWAKNMTETKIVDGNGFVTSYPTYVLATSAQETSVTQHGQIQREIYALINKALQEVSQNQSTPTPLSEPVVVAVPEFSSEAPVAPAPVETLVEKATDTTVTKPVNPPVKTVVAAPVVITKPALAPKPAAVTTGGVAAKPTAPVAVIVPVPMVAPSVVSAPQAPAAAPVIAPQSAPAQVAVTQKEPPPPPAPIVKAEPVKIRIHYFRADGNYQPWSVHAWEPDIQELTGGWLKQAHFQKLDEYGAVFEIDPARLKTKQVGFIIRRGEAKDCDADREWNIGKSLEIWTVSNSCAVYYDKAQALSTIRRL